MPNAKGKYEIDEISSDKNTFEARVSVNGDFFNFLNQLDWDGHHKEYVYRRHNPRIRTRKS